MIKLKTSQPQSVLIKLMNKNVLKHPVYIAHNGLIINSNDKHEALKVFKELDLRVK
jgi:hypothetical protein